MTADLKIRLQARLTACEERPLFDWICLLVGKDAMPADALFQVGMDLDHGSSPAQTEEPLSRRDVPDEGAEHNDFFREIDGMRYAGTHLLIDLIGAERLDDLDHIDATLRRCVEVSGATLLHIHLHRFTPSGGITGVAVLAESHISIHTWPEHDYAALDVFMCGDTEPEAAIDVMTAAFAPSEVVVKTELRGKDLERWNGGSKRHCMTASASA